MNVGEIKKKASEFFTEYLNHTIDSCCAAVKTDDDVDDFFPMEILKNTSRFSDTLKDHSQEMLEVFLHSKNKTGVGYSVEMESINTRSNGRKSIIKRIYFAEENDYLDFVNVRSRVENLKSALAVLSQDGVLPTQQLRNWAKKHVKDLTVAHNENTIFWHNIGQCALLGNKGSKESPAHIPSDFINTNKKLIQSLFGDGETEIQISNQPEPVEEKNESPSFEQPVIESVEEENPPETKSTGKKTQRTSTTVDSVQLATLSKPFSIRFRSLSNTTPLKLGRLVPKEISIPLDDFVHLNQTNFLKEITTVLIVNDETIFQTFPASEHVLCIFGPDYAVNALKLCEWFGQFQLIYFGDISEHCFDVLSAFRNSWMKTESICMDGNTWERFFNSAESGPHLKNNVVPKNLTDSEKNTFLSLRLTAGKNKLPQEKIPLDYMAQFLEAIKVCGPEEDQPTE